MIDEILLVSSILLGNAVIFSKIGRKFGVPSLVIFILVGILASSDGIGGIYFSDYGIAQFVGIIAISYILFMGGISFDIEDLKPVAKEGLTLATFGVLITATVVAICSYSFLHFTILECFLLGAIISSTDAAAVFSVMRSKNISLKDNLKPLLEFESGSNDPMAVFLTIGTIWLITGEISYNLLLLDFFKQMILGTALGYLVAHATTWVINKIRLENESLYVVITLASVLFTYSAISILGGNGFIGVYVCGLTMSALSFVHKKMLIKFHDSIAWLMQVVMFVILGLLVNMKEVFSFTWQAMIVSLILIFIARPLAVFVTGIPFKHDLREKLMISWVGLRGAAPIVLATFPLTAHIPHAEEIFNIVFFVVIVSLLVQGTTIPFIAKLLKVDAPLKKDHNYILDFDADNKTRNTMIEFTIPENSIIVGKKIKELSLPDKSLVSLIYQGGEYSIPTKSTVIEACDVLFIMMDEEKEDEVRKRICTLNIKGDEPE